MESQIDLGLSYPEDEDFLQNNDIHLIEKSLIQENIQENNGEEEEVMGFQEEAISQPNFSDLLFKKCNFRFQGFEFTFNSDYKDTLYYRCLYRQCKGN